MTTNREIHVAEDDYFEPWDTMGLVVEVALDTVMILALLALFAVVFFAMGYIV